MFDRPVDVIMYDRSNESFIVYFADGVRIKVSKSDTSFTNVFQMYNWMMRAESTYERQARIKRSTEQAS